MRYIEIVNDAIQYIESNLHRQLSLEELAARYYVSPTHFYRIFQALTNQTVKSYILGRKLSAAANALWEATDRNVADIAFQYGFNSHEQFTRDFFKMFRVTPSRFRKERVFMPLVEEMYIPARDFINKREGIVVNHCCRELNEIKLLGKEVSFNPECPCEMEEMVRIFYNCCEEYVDRGPARRWFGIGGSDSGDPSRRFGFYGIAAEEHRGDRSELTERIIPATRYAVFVYPGFMAAVSRTVTEDLDKWFRVSGLSLNNSVGFDFFELFSEDYRQTGKFYLHIPVI